MTCRYSLLLAQAMLCCLPGAILPGPWTPPVNLGAVNTDGTEQRATLSQDGKRLYFGRVPVNGTSDIYVSEREPK